MGRLPCLQVASAAARAASYAIELSFLSSMPRMPLFIRAAELSAAISRLGPHAFVGIPTMEDLVNCFISDIYKDTSVERILTEFLKLQHMLIFIDRLDKAADN